MALKMQEISILRRIMKEDGASKKTIAKMENAVSKMQANIKGQYDLIMAKIVDLEKTVKILKAVKKPAIKKD